MLLPVFPLVLASGSEATREFYCCHVAQNSMLAVVLGNMFCDLSVGASFPYLHVAACPGICRVIAAIGCCSTSKGAARACAYLEEVFHKVFHKVVDSIC